MKLPRGFSPIRIVQAAGIRGNASFRQPPGGGWTGTLVKNDGGQLLVEELEAAWKVTDVYAGTSSWGTDLAELLKEMR